MELHRGLKATDLGNGTTRVSGKCFVTGEDHSIVVSTGGLSAWLNGEGHAQDLLPLSSNDDREFLISGTSPQGWRRLFGNEEEGHVGHGLREGPLDPVN